jgi:hypothetical protein
MYFTIEGIPYPAISAGYVDDSQGYSVTRLSYGITLAKNMWRPYIALLKEVASLMDTCW